MSERETESMSRRDFFRRSAAATAAVGAAAGATGSAAAQEDEGGGGTTIAVGPGGEFVFEPGTDEPAYAAVGETVTWEWESDNHNIAVESQPDGADWEGHEPIENTGFTYEYTFEVEGTYEYVCVPHESLGMYGELIVNESGAPPGGGGEGGGEPVLPDSAKTIGVATMTAMMSTLVFAYFFLKYGGDYGTVEQ